MKNYSDYKHLEKSAEEVRAELASQEAERVRNLYRPTFLAELYERVEKLEEHNQK